MSFISFISDGRTSIETLFESALDWVENSSTSALVKSVALPILTAFVKPSDGRFTQVSLLEKDLTNWCNHSQTTGEKEKAKKRILDAFKRGDKELNLSGLQLSSLPCCLGKFTQLTCLDLSGNQLAELPAEIGLLSNLTDLILCNNQLMQLPTEIGKLTHLTSLDLSCNRLIQVPAEIGNLAKLKTITLHDNQLQGLPNEICNLTHLTRLELFNNELTELPHKIDNLKNLKSLSLTGNPFLKFSASIGNLLRRANIFLFGRQITIFDLWEQLLLQFYPREQHRQLYNDRKRVFETGVISSELKDLLKCYLDRLTESADFQENGLAQKELVLQVERMLQATRLNERFRDLLPGLLFEALETCCDRTTMVAANIEIQRIMLTENLDDAQLAQLLIGLIRLNRVDQVSKALANWKFKPNDFEELDEVEPQLAFRIHLKGPLNLPITTTEMTFEGKEGFTNEEIDRIGKRIRSKNPVNLLLSSPIWIKRMEEKHAVKIEKLVDLFQNQLANLLENPELSETEKLLKAEKIQKNLEQAKQELIEEKTREILQLDLQTIPLAELDSK